MLTLADISDARAYEREREAFRAEIIALKKRRRVAIGPIVTVVFENRATIRFQIQEMARAEKMTTDAAIKGELDAYNPLIPRRGELSMTVFIELVTEEQLREWLPKLVGIEGSFGLRLGGPEAGGGTFVRAGVEEGHESQLTREEVTASVHYVRISLDDEQAGRFAEGPAAIAVDHPDYHHETVLSDETRASITGDW